jgi:hypothetical protein
MSGRTLVYTIAFDPSGSPAHRGMAKILVSSLLRTYFSGEILVLRNSTEPLFHMERGGLTEVLIDSVQDDPGETTDTAWRWKYRARHYFDASQYDRVMFIDADCIALRNIDHLLEGDWDIAYQPERGEPITTSDFNGYLSGEEMSSMSRPGINSGAFSIRGTIFNAVMEHWEKVHEGLASRPTTFLEQSAWNRVILDTIYKTKAFERDGIMFPCRRESAFSNYLDASVLHAQGVGTLEKMKFLFGTYAHTFQFDDNLTLLNLLEP